MPSPTRLKLDLSWARPLKPFRPRMLGETPRAYQQALTEDQLKQSKAQKEAYEAQQSERDDK